MKHTCKLTRSERIDIITDAIETRAIQYWAYEESGIELRAWRNDEGGIYKVVITMPHESNDGSNKEYTVTPAVVQKGIDLILSNADECGIRDDIKESILMDDNDSESCDCIIQAGLFGK